MISECPECVIDDFRIDLYPNAYRLRKYLGSDKIVNIPSNINGEKIKVIGGYSFCMNHFIKEVIIPRGVTDINIHAFAACPNLKTIVMPDTITSIHKTAFYRCNSLNKVIFKGTPEQWDRINRESICLCKAEVIYEKSSELSNFLNTVSNTLAREQNK